MATVKVTFTLDEATVEQLNETASRLSKPKSEVVREAIRDFHSRADRLSEAERQRLLRAVDVLILKPATRSQQEVDRELREIRESRQRGWRRSTD
jgi:predicted transcriptional regulator